MITGGGHAKEIRRKHHSPCYLQGLQDPARGFSLIEDVEMKAGDTGVKESLALPDGVCYPHVQLAIGIIPILFQFGKK